MKWYKNTLLKHLFVHMYMGAELVTLWFDGFYNCDSLSYSFCNLVILFHTLIKDDIKYLFFSFLIQNKCSNEWVEWFPKAVQAI